MLLICLWLGVYRPDGLNVFSSSLSPITDPYTARLWFATGGMRVNARICSLNMADATILTVHSGKTRKGQINISIKRLQQAKAHLIGTLLNHTNPSKSGYNYDYLHYNYGGTAPKEGFFKRLFS